MTEEEPILKQMKQENGISKIRQRDGYRSMSKENLIVKSS